MNKRIFIGIILGFSCLIGVCQNVVDSSCYYYYKGEKQYLELDTKHVFVSVAEKDTANTFVANKFLRADIPETMQRKNHHKRFWTVLKIEDSLSDEAYRTKLSEIKNGGTDIITALGG